MVTLRSRRIGFRSSVARTDAQIALDLTERQLLDAYIIDAKWHRNRRYRSKSVGTVNQLLVEIEDTFPDRYVHMSLEGLVSVTVGNNRHVRTRVTREQLMAFPEARR